MRLTALLLTVFLINVQAAVSAQNITLSGENLTFKQIFTAINKQTGYATVFNKKKIPEEQTFSISATNMALTNFLDMLSKKKNISYYIEGKTIFFTQNLSTNAPSPIVSDPKRTLIPISGFVLDAEGHPLIGTTIRIKGKNTSTVADDKGQFNIAAEVGDVLLASFVGYEEKEVKVTGVSPVVITLAQSETTLEVAEIVSTGYQQISRERSAGSYSKPELSVVKNRSSSINILQRLDGLVPGLTVNNAPDAADNPFLIRGLTSINSTRSPLIVVDGVELQGVNIRNINPQDVADITVLKDATAASIWGAKAANGVIVITTKKGRPGEKLSVEYDGYYNYVGRPDRNYIQRMGSREFIATVKEIFPEYSPYNSWSTVKLESVVTPHLQIQYDQLRGLISPSRADAMLDSLAGIDNNDEIMDLFYQKAATTNHTVSISGGGAKYAFYGSFNYTGLKSSTPGEKENMYKVNLRQDFTPNKRLQLFLVTDLSNSVSSAGNMSALTNSSALGRVPLSRSTVPYQHFRDANGNPLAVNYFGDYSDSLRLNYAARSRINLDYVPLEEMNMGYSKDNNLSARLVGGLKLKLVKGLRFEGTYGYNVASSNSRTVLFQESYLVRSEVMTYTQAANVNTIPKYYLPATGGRKTEVNSLIKNWTVRNQLIYDHDWKLHQLTLLGGQEATSTSPFASTVIARGWDDQLQLSRQVDYAALASGIPKTVPGGTRILDENYITGGEGVASRTTSYYSNLSYSYDRKYTINASWRIDQSNLFGLDKSAQNRPVWSVGGKWGLGSEDFMRNVNWLERLDLRFTYGVAGNAPTPGTAASHDILQGDANVGYNTGVGLIIATPANNKLTWESTTVYNWGIDFGVLGGRLGGSIDGYIKRTHDLIGILNTAPLTGYAGVTGNFGDMDNKGIDLSLSSINLTGGNNFLWTTIFTLGFNKNKITNLVFNAPISTGEAMTSTRYLAGYPAFTMFGYKYDGLNEFGNPQIIQKDGKVFSEASGSKAEDMLFMGTSQPIWSGGLFNNFQYKNFQLGINISYNAGHVLLRDVNSFWSGIPYDNTMAPEFSNRWKVPGDEARTNIPKYAESVDAEYSRNTGYYVYANSNYFNASFAKIRDITLSYALPEKINQRLKTQEISFRFQVSNLMLWKANHLGIDPEFHGIGGRSMRTGQGQLTVGAHISF